ncbi:hypothetical protein CR513_27597, partial [Mucuna pruriens]
MPITRNQASSTNEGEEDMLQRLLRTVAQLQAWSDEHSKLSAEAKMRHRLVEERHAEAMRIVEQREEELQRQIANLKARNEQDKRQPFCEEIDEARIPPNFREILVDLFDRTQDPHAHLQAFQTQMYISGGDDRLSCKLFSATLRGVALQWMMNVPPRSIRTFNDLATNKSKCLEVADLFDIRQASREILKSYMARFNDVTVWVNDPDQKFSVKAFQKGLKVGPFSDALALQKSVSMEEIRVRVEKHVEMEESRFDKREAEHVNVEGRSQPAKEGLTLVNGRNSHCRQVPNKGYEILPKFTPLKEKKAHMMREICHTRLLNFPQAAGGLIQQGQLGQYIARAGREKVKSRGEPSGGEAKRNREYDACYRGTISTILGGEESYGNQDDQMRRNAYQSYQVQGVLTGANLTPLGKRRKEPTITFQDEDRKWRTVDKDEPMVISVIAEHFRIERVLIDQGSSANILYRSTYLRMSLLGLKETPGCLYGFSGERVPIKGTVELDTIFGEGSNTKVIPILYMIVEAEASYNIIMGRPALNRLKAIVSTYHLCMKYPIGGGVGSVCAHSNMARRCYEDNLRVGQRMLVVNTPSLELDPRSHDERERPYPMEELKEIQIGLQEVQKTKIGTIMTKEQEADLTRCLQQNRDVFAWAPEDMPGIDPNFMSHRLSIVQEAQPIM